MLKALVFDFDGVILESVNIKTKAFVELFKGYPEHLEKIVMLHLDNGGMSRYEKFKIIYRDYLGQQLEGADIERLGQVFSGLVYQQILHCLFVPGAYQFLQTRAQQYDLFVASGTPEDELQNIVQQRKLAGFFCGVYGSPRSKTEILKMILEENSLHSQQAIFIGDALSDCLSARDLSVPFIGRVPNGEPSPFPGDDVIEVVEDLHQLDRQWDSLMERLS